MNESIKLITKKLTILISLANSYKKIIIKKKIYINLTRLKKYL